MFFRLLLLFTLVPLVELWLLIEIGRRTSVPATIALVLTTGALGAWLARSQGVATFARVRREMSDGRMPATALVDGLLILVAGAVLLTPGLLTDLFGFFLLVPAGRTLVRKALAERFRGQIVTRSVAYGSPGPPDSDPRGPAAGSPGTGSPGTGRSQDQVIDIDDYEIVNERER